MLRPTILAALAALADQAHVGQAARLVLVPAVGLEDGLADAGKRLAPPVREFCDQPVDTLRWSHWIFMPLFAAGINPAQVYSGSRI